MAHSYSAVKLYEQCPARYKFNRIANNYKYGSFIEEG